VELLIFIYLIYLFIYLLMFDLLVGRIGRW